MTVGRLARILLFPLLCLAIVVFFISLMFGCGGDDAATPDYSSDNVEYIELTTPRGKIACVLHYNGGIACDWGGP